MKSIRLIGLLAMVAGVSMAIAASASATVATAPAGTLYTGTLKGSGSATFHGITDVTCKKGEIEGPIASHGASVTGKGQAASFTWSECNHPITALKKGSIEVHAIGNGVGTITSTGTEATVVASTIFGKVHCIYGTNNTDLGVVTSATSSTGHATVHLEGPLDDIPTNPLCGATVEMTGSGIVTSPTGLVID